MTEYRIVNGEVKENIKDSLVNALREIDEGHQIANYEALNFGRFIILPESTEVENDSSMEIKPVKKRKIDYASFVKENIMEERLREVIEEQNLKQGSIKNIQLQLNRELRNLTEVQLKEEEILKELVNTLY